MFFISLPIVARAGEWVYYDDELDWIDAEAQCRQDGGHLASLHLPEEDEQIRAMVAFIDDEEEFWIGGNDLGDAVSILDVMHK